MRVILILLGLLLMIGGGAVAGAQYAPPDLLKMLDSAPQQARDFLQTPTALYAGAGGAGFGLLLVIIAAVTGGKKKEKGRSKPAAVAMPVPAPARVQPQPAAPAAAALPPQRLPEPKPAPAPQPAMAEAAAAPQPAPASPEPPKPKPQASAHPPAAALQPRQEAPVALSETGDKVSIADAVRKSPLLYNRKRVSDLVTINDALKAYFKKHNAYPVANGLGGMAERGAAWIPGLAPEFVPELPRDPAMEAGGPQYVYASDGKDYKLLAHNVSLVGGTNVEVLGVKVDMTRQPTMENASFGYWTPGFAEV